MDSLCAIVFNMMILMNSSSLYPTHTDKCTFLQRGFPNSSLRAPIGRWVEHTHNLFFFFFKADIEYPFEHSEVINYTLDGVSIHPVTTTIQA